MTKEKQIRRVLQSIMQNLSRCGTKCWHDVTETVQRKYRLAVFVLDRFVSPKLAITKLLASAVLLLGFLLNSSVASPSLLVTDQGIQPSGNLGWLVQVAPDPNLFVQRDQGLGGSLAVELAFEVQGNNLVSATFNAVDWPYQNYGNNPFNGGHSEGLSADLSTGTLFAAFGSEFFTNGDSIDLLTFETAGAVATDLTWGGHALLVGTLGQYTGSRIAQAGTNFDGYQGNLKAIPCDLNGDTVCDVADVNQMYAEGDLVAGVTSMPGNVADLDGNSQINGTDIDVWLDSAAQFNGYSSPYKRGDADNLGELSPAKRDVDITDFNILATNFLPAGDGNPTNGPFWDQANFDGDDDVDITDFNFLAANFRPVGYGGSTTSIPEPGSFLLVVTALVLWTMKRSSLYRGPRLP